MPKERRAAALNASSTSGWTALMTAAENGQVKLIFPRITEKQNKHYYKGSKN